MAEEGNDDSQRLSFSSRTQPKVVIIGAGISGIAAAHDLSKAGFTDFVILEATDRVGGRIWSVDLETNGQKAELGANWIHGIELNPIYKIAMQNNLLSNLYQGRKLGQKMLFLRDNGEAVNTKIVEEVDWTYGMLISQCEDFFQSHLPTPEEDDSVGAFVEREFLSKMQKYPEKEQYPRMMVLKQRLLGECIISGCHSMNEVALSEVGSFQELPGVHYVIPPGFETVVHILQKAIPEENILLDHPVSQITWSSEETDNLRQLQDAVGGAAGGCGGENGGQTDPPRACVQCQNGKKFYADMVLSTVSLGYLKRHSGRLFNPPLPDYKLNAINRVAMGTVNKIVLEFDGPVLPEGIFRLEMIWDRDEAGNGDLKDSWIKKIGSFEAIADNVLMGWLSGREAEYIEHLTEAEIGKKCVEVLKKFLKNTVRDIPLLKHVVRTNWKTSPYTLGSYSFLQVGAHADDIDALGEPVPDQHDKPVLLFCGEATHPTFYSSSHGALLSGQREAQRILDLVPH